MYTIGSLADLISGADTPNKLAVKVKEVQYKKPVIKKTKFIKNSGETINKAPLFKSDNLDFKSQGSGYPKFNKSQGNGNPKFNKPQGYGNPKFNKPQGYGNPKFNKQQGYGIPKFNKSQGNGNSKFNKSQGNENANFNKSQGNGNAKFNKFKGKKYDKPVKNQTPEEETVENPDIILKNKKLNNAEKRKMLKRIAPDSETPKAPKPKKAKLEKHHDEDDRTIFVGNVPLDTEEKELKQFFSKYGQVETIRFRGIPTADMKTPKKVALIKKEFHPKRTTMLAYVRFQSSKDAISAKNANGQEFKNLHLRVDYLNDERDHDKKKSVFIGNLPLDAAEEDVRKLFEVCGAIDNIRLVRDQRTNMGKGFGFVNFHSLDAVELASQMENVMVGKRELRIKRCSNPKEKNKKKTADGKKIRERYAIHINSLPKNANETELRDVFKKCGKILSVRIQEAQEGKSCYINFENTKAVDKAVNMKNPTLRSVVLKVNECKPNLKKEIQRENLAMYVSQLPLNTKKEDLCELFEGCLNASVFSKKTRPTAVGFVNFKTEEALENALKKKYKIGNTEITISKKTAKKEKQTVEKTQDKDVDAEDTEDTEDEVEDEADAEELIRDINGSKKWEDSDSSEADEDEDVENEGEDDVDDNEDDDDSDDDNVANNDENENETEDEDKAEEEAEDDSDKNDEEDEESDDNNEENDDEDD